ncbi:hypothetical protein DSECCO2_353390 [anaerobic digester metagenome]
MPVRKRKEIQKMLRSKRRRIKGADTLIDLYEITENLKRFNAILNEVGGSL